MNAKKHEKTAKTQKLPDTNKLESVSSAGKAILSLIPFAGGPLSELLGASLSIVIRKRIEEWQLEIIESLEQLKDKVENLSQSAFEKDTFVDTLLTATQLAVRTSSKEKLRVLRNAVLNSFLPQAPEENLQTMFLSLVDTLSAGELKVLAVYGDYDKAAEILKVGPNKVIDFSQIGLRVDIFRQYHKNLVSRGLVKEAIGSFDYQIEFGEYKAVAPDLTELGKEFLAFIKSPLDEPEKII